MCAGHVARLCTASELKGNVARHTGCLLDRCQLCRQMHQPRVIVSSISVGSPLDNKQEQRYEQPSQNNHLE